MVNRVWWVNGCGSVLLLLGAGCKDKPEQVEPPKTQETSQSQTAGPAVPSSSDASPAKLVLHPEAIDLTKGSYLAETQTLISVGRGLPQANAKGREAELGAARAAKLIAERNMLQNYAKLIGKDNPDGSVQGILRLVREVSRDSEKDGSVSVTLAVSIKDIELNTKTP